MQELRICVYEADDGLRVGSVDGDRVYDLDLCCAARLEGQGVADPFGVADVMAPSEPGRFPVRRRPGARRGAQVSPVGARPARRRLRRG